MSLDEYQQARDGSSTLDMIAQNRMLQEENKHAASKYLQPKAYDHRSVRNDDNLTIDSLDFSIDQTVTDYGGTSKNRNKSYGSIAKVRHDAQNDLIDLKYSLTRNKSKHELGGG